MPKRLSILCVLLITYCCRMYAQSGGCPANIDFEYGNFSNWQLFIGNCCPIGTPFLTGPIAGRHTITSGTGTDPYGGFPIVAPNGGNYSLKLGNDQIGGQAERARYYVHIPNTPGDYIFLYRYAVVLEDPNHLSPDQPRFEVTAFDSASGNPIPCAQFSYVASPVLPGFVKVPNTVVWYKSWTTASIDLSPYSGLTIAIDFSSGDCSQGGHFGYGYVDMNCGLFKIITLDCNKSPTITLSAPPGFKNYKWMDSSLTTTISTLQNATIPTPATPRRYAVILTPYPGFGCPDTLYTVYKVDSMVTTAMPDTTICYGTNLKLSAKGTSIDTPYTYQWSPSTYLSCTTCANPIASPLSTINYRVIVTTNSGCADTDFVKLTVDTVVLANVIPAKDTICQHDVLYVTNSFGLNPPTTSYTWTTDSGTIVSSTKNAINVKWAKPGLKKIKLIVADGSCLVADSQYVYVKPSPDLTLSDDTTICWGASGLLVASCPDTPVVYGWLPATSLSCSTCTQAYTSTLNDITYKVYVTNKYKCADTESVNIHVDKSVTAKISKPVDTICEFSEIELKNIAVNTVPVFYSWTLDSGKAVSGASTDKITAKWYSPGLKKVHLYISNGTCIARDSQYLYIKPSPDASFEIPHDICINDIADLNHVEQQGIYRWLIEGQTITDTTYRSPMKLSWNTLGPKKMRLFIEGFNGCNSIVFDTNVVIRPYPLAEIKGITELSICADDTISLRTESGNNYTYEWAPKDYFLENNVFDVLAIVPRSGFVSVKTTNKWGCADDDTQYIATTPCCDIFFPDAFTPNGDGRNDLFRIIAPVPNDIITFAIFNRWGNTLFSTTNSNTGWDGTYNQMKQDMGTYYYYVKYRCADGHITEMKGNFLLLR